MEKPPCCRVGEDEDEEEMEFPGFRFHPTEEELVSFYLRKRVEGRPLAFHYLITDLDIYKCDPWDLPRMARLGEGQREWYFFCPRDRKYRNSTRPNRVTVSGFWKATGTDRQVYSVSSSQCIGLKKSLVFYQGRASKGTKTDWMMHEFRLPSPPNSSHKDTCWAICKIFKRKASTSHCTTLNSQASIFGERPCSGGPTSEKSLATLHTHANHDSLGGDDFSEEDSKSQNSTPTSFSSPISVSPSNSHIQSSHTSSDKIAMGHLIKPSGSVEINTPSSMQRKPLKLRVSESSNSGANWADDIFNLLFTPISKPSDNLGMNGQSCTLGDTFFLDQSVQESMQLLTPDCLGQLVCSPQGNFTLPLWDQPGFLHDSSSFYAMSG